MPWMLVSGNEHAWEEVVLGSVKARPAITDASHIFSRASSLCGSATAIGRYLKTSLAACTAHESQIGWCPLLQNPSIAWLSTSMPVLAVIFGGTE